MNSTCFNRKLVSKGAWVRPRVALKIIERTEERRRR